MDEAVGQNSELSSTAGCRKPFLKLRWSDLKPVFADSVTGWIKHNTPRLGAALAFYTLLSIIPLLLIAISIAGVVFGPRAAQANVVQQLQFVIGEQRARIVQALLEGAQNRADGFLATALGTLTLLFGASGMVTELRSALNTIWEVPSRQRTTFQEITAYVKERLWSVALVLAVGLLLTGSLAINTWVSAVGELYASMLPSPEIVLHMLNAGFTLVLMTLLFGAVYKIVPEVPVKWADVWLGAAVTAILFTIGNLLLGIYLGKSTFSSTYGAAASTVVLTVWVYYSSQIFFLGAEFTRAFAQRCGSHPMEPLPNRFHRPPWLWLARGR
jgi:membrane protein